MSINSVGSTNFETYLESWNGNVEAAVTAMLNDPNFKPGTAFDMSFGDFTFSKDGSGYITIGGLDMPMSEFQSIIDQIHARGGVVKLSLGGATYSPAGKLTSETAQNIAAVMNQCGLDGVDLDIEDPTVPASQITSFIQTLREDIGSSKSISLTLPGQDYSIYPQLIPSVKDYVDHFNIMEYDIWVDPSKGFVGTIESDIQDMIKTYGLDPSQISLGLMPGKDDMGHDLTVDDATQLAQFAKQLGLGGVFIWDADRDYQGLDGQPSYAYTDAIEKVLNG